MAAKSILKWASSCPIVVIFGATGTGKSKLAIEIAKRFNGEIISVDSMQVYLGLDIITNKVTKDEQSNIPHHLMNFVNPFKGITVVDFRDRALKVIEELHNKGKLPVLVGGTMYYMESILFNVLMSDPDLKYPSNNFTFGYDVGRLDKEGEEEGEEEEEEGGGGGGGEGGERKGLSFSKKARISEEENMSSEDLHKQLCQVDPEMGKSIHPRDRRKTLRCLEMFRKSGGKMSVAIMEQKAIAGANNYGGPVRFPRAIMLWLKCDKSVLDERLEQRVDKMMEDGLIEELLDFHNAYNKMRLEKNELADYTKGIFQAIGFKEFHEYLILEEKDRKSQAGEKLLRKCTEYLKIINKQYARKQLRWIKRRLLCRGGQMPPIYDLDATDISLWNEKVFAIAEDIVDSLLVDRRPSSEPLPIIADEKDKNIIECHLCKRYFQGTEQYENHLKGRRHLKMISSKKNKDAETETEEIISNVSNNITQEIKPENI